MRKLQKNISDEINWWDEENIQFVLMGVLMICAISVYAIFLIFEKVISAFDTESNILIGFFLGILIPTSFYFIDKYKKRNGPLYSKTDKNMFKIAYNFIKIKKIDKDKSFEILSELFASYSPVETKKIFEKTKLTKPDINLSCKIILKESNEVKFFVLYTLIDIAAIDGLLTPEEEQFIDEIRRKIGIHIKTYHSIKKSYLKKGLKDEKKILEEQNRKKLMHQFSKYMFPYEAYRILGVSPTVTKAQLKKAYRTLAKKHHPDKHLGQNAVEIQKAEDKFQEIKEAYDVIKKNKNY